MLNNNQILERKEILNADERYDDNEIKFIKLLRSKLELHDETINDRFGNFEILHTNEFSGNIISVKETDFIENTILP